MKWNRNGILLAALVVLGFSFCFELYANFSRRQSLSQEIRTAQIQLDDLQTLSSQDQSSEQDSVQAIEEMNRKGDEVAALQNSFPVKPEQPGYEEAYTEAAQAVSAYFAEDEYDRTNKWYKPDPSKTDAQWQFVSRYQKNQAEIPVWWVCRDPSTGSLLAAANASYSPSSGLFGKLEYFTTRTGSYYLPSDTEYQFPPLAPESEQTPETLQQDLTDKIDAIDLDISQSQDVTDDDLAKIKQAQEDAYEKSLKEEEKKKGERSNGQTDAR